MKKYKDLIFYGDDILYKTIDKKYKILQVFKDDNRTFVAKIELDDKFYILKKIFYPKKIKKLQTIFKKGEGLATYQNTQKLIEKIPSLVPIYGVIQKKNIFLKYEIMLIKWVNGKKPKTQDEYKLVLKSLQNIYKENRFHGDCNDNNFLIDGDKITIIDTKLKSMWFGNYRKHYDFMTFNKHITPPLSYPYHKNIYYYFALGVRKFRDFRRNIKENRR